MAWARLDDRWHDHPKVIAAGLEASGLWAMCLTWAHRSRRGSDRPGFVPKEVVSRFAGSKANRLGCKLTEVGLFEVADGGWMIHDFTSYLPKYDPKQAAAAGRKGAEARWGEHPDEPPPDDEPPYGPDDGSLQDRMAVRSRTNGEPMARADAGGSARRNPTLTDRGYLGSGVTEPDARLQPLRTALERVRLVVRWDKLDSCTVDRIAWLADVHGVGALVAAAQRAWQRDDPPAFANAWLGTWDSLPLPKPHLVAELCSAHHLEKPCRSCAADLKAAQ